MAQTSRRFTRRCSNDFYFVRDLSRLDLRIRFRTAESILTRFSSKEVTLGAENCRAQSTLKVVAIELGYCACTKIR